MQFGLNGFIQVRVALNNHLESFRGGQVGFFTQIELSDEHVMLGQEGFTFFDFGSCLRFVLTVGEGLHEFQKCFLGFFDGGHVAVNRLNQLKMAEGQFVLRVRGEHVLAVQFQKMLIFSDGFDVALFFVKRFRAFQDDVGVIIHFNGVPDENLRVGSLDAGGVGRRVLLGKP